jgi:uncharacterized protein
VNGYTPRLTDPLLAEMLEHHPAVLVTGPRACGKTTSAMRLAATVVRLDVPARAAAFEADPDAALGALTETPILIDEWQEVPGIVGAVKRAVDLDSTPGRYILSGSVRAPFLHGTWPGTGRLVGLPMTTLSMRERRGNTSPPSLLELLSKGDTPTAPTDPPDLVGYVDMALAGGFPEPILSLDQRGAARWHSGYIDQLVGRDAAQLGKATDPRRLAAYLRAYALSSAGTVDQATLFEAADINRRTAQRYEAMLEALFVVESIPAWTVNRLKSLTLLPKRVFVDTGLWGSVVGVESADVLADGDLLGRLLETFVIAQLRAELPRTPRIRLHHVRTKGGRHEVDIVADLGAGKIIGIEVKATASPRPDDARHLAWLRDEMGETFVAGAVLHTGPSVYPLGDRLLAVPICALWA